MNNLTFKNGTYIEWGVGDDGGGSTQYTDFLTAIPSGNTYRSCLEWCAGLSAISFSLLDAQIIENCVLMDIYEPALLTAVENAKKNGIENKVKYYVCDEIQKLPITEKFDLVVSNPPHCFNDLWMDEKGDLTEIVGLHRRLVLDKEGKLHNEFFSNITRYLNKNADIFLSETAAHDFLIDIARENGLTYINSVSAPALADKSNSQSVIMRFKYETEIH